MTKQRQYQSSGSFADYALGECIAMVRNQFTGFEFDEEDLMRLRESARPEFDQLIGSSGSRRRWEKDGPRVRDMAKGLGEAACIAARGDNRQDIQSSDIRAAIEFVMSVCTLDLAKRVYCVGLLDNWDRL